MSLAALLYEHPFPDEAGLLHIAERSMTAGEARARSRQLADELAIATHLVLDQYGA